MAWRKPIMPNDNLWYFGLCVSWTRRDLSSGEPEHIYSLDMRTGIARAKV
jgi:hypothetical protein